LLLVGLLACWLAGLLACRLAGWSAGSLAGWLGVGTIKNVTHSILTLARVKHRSRTFVLVGVVAYWLAGLLDGRLARLLAGWLVGWLAGWLACCLGVGKKT
jgi:hypothetical protein